MESEETPRHLSINRSEIETNSLLDSMLSGASNEYRLGEPFKFNESTKVIISQRPEDHFVVEILHSKRTRIIKHAFWITISIAYVLWQQSFMMAYLLTLSNGAAYIILANPTDDAVLDAVARSSPNAHRFSTGTVCIGIALGLLLLALDVWRYW